MTEYQQKCRLAAFVAFCVAGVAGVAGGVFLDAPVFVLLGAAALVGGGSVFFASPRSTLLTKGNW